jgi:hypothetical protein
LTQEIDRERTLATGKLFGSVMRRTILHAHGEVSTAFGRPYYVRIFCTWPSRSILEPRRFKEYLGFQSWCCWIFHPPLMFRSMGNSAVVHRCRILRIQTHGHSRSRSPPGLLGFPQNLSGIGSSDRSLVGYIWKAAKSNREGWHARKFEGRRRNMMNVVLWFGLLRLSFPFMQQWRRKFLQLDDHFAKFWHNATLRKINWVWLLYSNKSAQNPSCLVKDFRHCQKTDGSVYSLQWTYQNTRNGDHLYNVLDGGQRKNS